MEGREIHDAEQFSANADHAAKPRLRGGHVGERRHRDQFARVGEFHEPAFAAALERELRGLHSARRGGIEPLHQPPLETDEIALRVHARSCQPTRQPSAEIFESSSASSMGLVT